MFADRTTLVQFLIEERRRHPDASGDLNGLILDVALACKAISNRVAAGALAGVLGSADHTNVQGEVQQKLDVLANRGPLTIHEQRQQQVDVQLVEQRSGHRRIVTPPPRGLPAMHRGPNRKPAFRSGTRPRAAGPTARTRLTSGTAWP
nr:hypothetical protein [Mycolicibacterium agri]